jgi:hypothetical protein
MRIVPPKLRRSLERIVIPCYDPYDHDPCKGIMRIYNVEMKSNEWQIDWVCPVCGLHHYMDEKWMNKTFHQHPRRMRVLQKQQIKS